MSNNNIRKYIVFIAHRCRWNIGKPILSACTCCNVIVACLYFWCADLNASPSPAAKASDAIMFTDMERADRKRRIVNSNIPIDITHRYIRNALLSQGKIHWDEPQSPTAISFMENFRHVEYSIEEYSGEGCNVTFTRRLATREGNFSSDGKSVEMGDTESSSRTFRFDATEVERTAPSNRIGVYRPAHPDIYKQESDDRDSARATIVVADIDVDGKSVEEISIYASLSELANGVSFADEFEAWLVHLVRMCRYPDENEVM